MGKDQKPNPSLSRRDFITGMAVTVAAAGAGVAALSPLINAEEIPSVDDFLQQHYERLTTDQKKRSLRDWKARSIRHMASRRAFPIRNR